MQAVARRLVICGMHVHVGLGDDELRIDLLGQISYFLPHLLALSTSSPFWQGGDTGLMSYRIAVFDELPRSGLPESFESWGEYARHVEILIRAGVIEDASKLWWDVRPSARFPTLELRIPDICTRLRDGISVAALYLCILRMLYRLKRNKPALAPLFQHADPGKPLARPALRPRRRADRLRRRRDRALRGFARGDDRVGAGSTPSPSTACPRSSTPARSSPAAPAPTASAPPTEEAIKAGAEPKEALEKVVDLLIEETVAGL